MIKLAALQRAGKAFANGSFVRMLETRARTQDEHDELVVFDLAEDIHVVLRAPFRMAGDVGFPFSQPVQDVRFPAFYVGDGRLGVRWILSVDAVQDAFGFGVEPGELEEVDCGRHVGEGTGLLVWLLVEIAVVDIEW